MKAQGTVIRDIEEANIPAGLMERLGHLALLVIAALPEYKARYSKWDRARIRRAQYGLV